MKMHTCVYAGSFDPITRGHEWMIRRGAAKYDRLVVAIGENPAKHPMFTLDERIALIRVTVQDLPNVEVTSFENKFLVHYAASIGAQYILRGIRNSADYLYESAMLDVNRGMNSNIETEFLIPPPELASVSSSMVKGLIGPEGWGDVVRTYVPDPVFRLFMERAHGTTS